MKIAVYCTGGTKLGFGHFFRSKTFVKAAPSDVQVLLVPVAEAENQHIFAEVASKTAVCADESSALQTILAFKPDIAVMDTVFCSDEFFDVLSSQVPNTASISPVFNQMSKVRYLFTRNINTLPIGDVTIYKGFEYAVFNENCRSIPDEVFYHNLGREFLTVGISMGGGDAMNKTLQVLRSISQLKIPCTFWVLLGEGYKHSYQELVLSILGDSNHEIILAKTNRSMWNVFSNCSIAILAGGLTTLEATYAGLPTLNIFEKEDHVYATGKQLFDWGVAEDIGIFNDASLERLRDRIHFFNDNRSQLLQMRERSKGKIDKLGATRIHDILRKIVG
jgi:spore coat polysaccharide biosynthesis predicted glycosyltransferase SpsG